MLIILISLSLLAYWLLNRGTPSIFKRPNLQKLVFFRDYLFLTMIPYVYQLSNNRYKHHYIFGQLDTPTYFDVAGIFAFIFILMFMLTYRIFQPALTVSLRVVNIPLNYRRLLLYLKAITLLAFLCFIFVSIKYDGGVVGLLKYSQIDLIVMRSNLSYGTGFLLFNKLAVKSWIPMIAYLMLYLHFSMVVQFKLSDKLCLIGVVLLGLFSSLWLFEKSAVVFYIIGIAGIYVFSGRPLRYSTSVLLPVVSVILVGLMYLIIYKDRIQDFSYLFDILVHRMTSQAAGSVMAIHYYDTHDFFYLSGISNTLASVSGNIFQTPYAAMVDFYVPAAIDTSGAMSSFAVGEAYGLFGPIGVLLSGFIVGAYYSFFEAIRSSRFLSVVFVGVYGLFFSHFYAASSFHGFLWPVGLGLQVVPFFFLSLLCTTLPTPAQLPVRQKEPKPVRYL